MKILTVCKEYYALIFDRVRSNKFSWYKQFSWKFKNYLSQLFIEEFCFITDPRVNLMNIYDLIMHLFGHGIFGHVIRGSSQNWHDRQK